jgi:hypothetical protein
MQVNMDTTKVVVFRRGGIVTRYEKWYYKVECIECVYVYKYLGLVYSWVMSWSKAKLTLAPQATQAATVLFVERQRLHLCLEQNKNIVLDYFIVSLGSCPCHQHACW